MEALLTVITMWLSLNFGLPHTLEHPRVELASTVKMAEVRRSRLASARASNVAMQPEYVAPEASGRDVHAIYDDGSRTVYLPEGWSATSPAEVSVLVHELVHHLQNVGGLKYICSGEREKPAYQAQARWLELFDKNLSDEFGLDPMTLLVRTNCLR